MNLICRVFGHRLESRSSNLVYIGEICTRCAHPVPDHLTPLPKSTRDTMAVIKRKDAGDIYVAVTGLDMNLANRGEGMEITVRGYAI